jgi:glutamate--cysteine ligase
MRGADASCVSHIAALSALWVGLLYDSESLNEAYELISGWDIKTLQEVRSQVPKKGLKAESGNIHAGNISKQICGIAREGLARRSENCNIENESRFLTPVCEITESGITQAEKLLLLYKNNFNNNLPGFIYNWQKEQMRNFIKEQEA